MFSIANDNRSPTFFIILTQANTISMTTQSFTAYTQPPCAHANGRYRTIRIKWWIFTFSREYFICKDCAEAIPTEDLPPDVWIPLETPVGTLFNQQVKKPTDPGNLW